MNIFTQYPVRRLITVKSSRYPIWKRLASLLLVLTLCLSSSGFAAFAEEFLLLNEEPAQADCEPALPDELLEEETEAEYLPVQELPRSEDEIPTDTAEADAQEHVPGSAQNTLEATPEQASSAGETAVSDAQLQTEAIPGTVRLAAGEELFPAGTRTRARGFCAARSITTEAHGRAFTRASAGTGERTAASSRSTAATCAPWRTERCWRWYRCPSPGS